MDLVATELEPTAGAVLSALRIFKGDPRLRERIERLVDERGSPTLRAGFDGDFKSGKPQLMVATASASHVLTWST